MGISLTVEEERKERANLLTAALLALVHEDPYYARNAPEYQAYQREILASDPYFRMEVILAILRLEGDSYLDTLPNLLCVSSLPWTAAEVEFALTCPGRNPHFLYLEEVQQVNQFVKSGGILSPAIRAVIKQRQQIYSSDTYAHDLKMSAFLARLIGEERLTLPYAGDSWGAMAIADLDALPSEEQIRWKRLFAFVEDCDAAKPSSIWRKNGKSLVAAVGEQAFQASIIRWFSAITPPPPSGNFEPFPSYGTQRNINLLKGMAWLCADSAEPQTARSLAQMVPALLKGPDGAWGIRAANGAIWALSAMECSEAIAQLGRLKLKVASRSTRLQVEKALESAAKRAGVTTADLEDLSAPTYGFDSVGIRSENFGDCKAVATLTATGEILVEWIGANGKAVKAPPAAVKQSYAAELKTFKAEIAAAATMLTAQKMRFDSFYLPERVWTLRTWHERFVAHPLLGNVARRLIWQFLEGEQQGEGIWSSERQEFVDVADQPLSWLTEATQVRLWHPITKTVDTVVAWKDYLQEHRITQPFKQAHREVYLLTDAERQCATYSNRFAAQLIKQHQMHALAALRGWRTLLHVAPSNYRPPAIKQFREYGLRAELWIEGVGDAHGDDVTGSGAYLYVATDQVRFYRLDAPENHTDGDGYTTTQQGQIREPVPGVPLAEVPALLFSEVMRDVDLFVGVGSIGNDAVWRDGGPEGRDQINALDYSSRPLSAIGLTRRDVLERLVPRLKIAARCTLLERSLVVRGDLHIYKIHLGSGNVLMEPNDQYLCIVAGGGFASNPHHMPFLPFEGDLCMSVILSKAFLLADDTHISDLTIRRQLTLP